MTTVVDAMMATKVGSTEENTISNKNAIKSMIVNDECGNTDYIHIKCAERVKDECFLLSNENNSAVHLSENRSLENIIDAPEQELEHMLYEDSQDLQANERQLNSSFSLLDSVETMENQNSLPEGNTMKEGTNECFENRKATNDMLYTSNTLKPILYEQCCDLSDIDECEESSMSLSQSCLQQIEEDFAQYNFEGTDIPSKVGKCVKVYSHKRRKSIDEIKTKLTDVNNIMQSPPSTDCIDLLDEPSTDDIPVTLLTSLDMESAEYIISLSTENIQSIVGATLNERHTLNTCKENEHIIDCDNTEENMHAKELNIESSQRSNCIKPILRRSLRLNQQEVEENVANNDTVKEYNGRERHFKKSLPNKAELCAKRKRKIKGTDRKVPEQKTFNSSRKNTTKLIVKKSHKPAYTIPNKEKDEQMVKINELKCDISETIAMDSIFTSPKISTIEHISRALWGDMSDFSEDYEYRMKLLEHTPNTEIPFAVGLLPLRTALEKMQATPDYQPRKTRSSVAPIKQDGNSLKRKSCTYSDKIPVAKKQHSCISDPKQNAKTVCHIQIRTAPSQYVRNRKKYLSTNLNTLEPQTIMNKQ